MVILQLEGWVDMPILGCPTWSPRNEPGDSPSVSMCRAPHSSSIFPLLLVKWSGFLDQPWPSSEGRWESQIHQLTWEHEPGPGGQLWKWTSPLKLGTWLCFQQGPYFIAHFWEYALSKPGSDQQASVGPIFFQNFHLFPCFTMACVSGSCFLDYTPGLKYIMNPLQCSGWQWKYFLKLSGLYASLTCCGVLFSLRFHLSAVG